LRRLVRTATLVLGLAACHAPGRVTAVDIGAATEDGGAPESPSGPTPDPTLRDVVQLSVGSGHVCAVTKSHSVVCWGDNATGEVGIGQGGRSVSTTVKRPHIVGDLPAIASVAAGKLHTCALDVRGEVYCWGSASADLVVTSGGVSGSVELKGRELGRPVRMPVGDGTARTLALSQTTYMACAGYPTEVRCWDTFRTIPIGAHEIPPPAVRTTAIAGVTAMALSHGKVCVVAGGLYCWRGALAAAPVTWAPGDAFQPAQIAMGEQYACAVSRAGDVRCWSSLIDDFWTRPPNLVVTWNGKLPTRALAVGDSPICTADSRGRVDCFLSEETGLTDDAIARSWASTGLGPHPIEGLGHVTALGLGLGRDVLGYGFGCALLSTSNVACWGDNESGQLGTGTVTSSKTPAFVVSAGGT
jgi:Regulator of chromosome condensation (RCC1) repeat